MNHVFFNSSLLYIEDIKDYRRHKYVVKYLPSKFKTVNIYTLRSKDIRNTTDFNSLPYYIAASRESFLKTFLYIEGLEDNYTIVRTKCSLYEYELFFSSEDNIVISRNAYDSLKNKSTLSDFLSVRIQSDFIDMFYTDFLAGSLPTSSIGNEVIFPSIPVFIERSLL